MKHVVLLVGPKGAGKSTIGAVLQAQLGVHFVAAEPLFLEVRAALGAGHPDVEREGFAAVVAAVQAALIAHSAVCVESTGASDHFPGVLKRLAALAPVVFVRVWAAPEQCVARIQARNASVHIPVSDETIARVNARAATVVLPWAVEIDNSGVRDDDAMCGRIATALGVTRSDA